MAGLEYLVVSLDASPFLPTSNCLAICGRTLEKPSYRAVFTTLDTCALSVETHDQVGVLHVAAKSHGDRLVHGPRLFVERNVVGTVMLLRKARRYHGRRFRGGRRNRFLHVSSDEVFG